MRNARIAAAVLMVLGGLGLMGAGGGDAGGSGAFFEEHLKELVRVEPKPLTAAAIGKVFSGEFYTLDLHAGNQILEMLVNRQDGTLVEVMKPTSTEAMPGLAKLVDPAFRLKTEGDAKQFEGALDALYPIEEMDTDKEKAKSIRHAGNTWTFVRGKFFEHFKGFVVETDGEGKVTGVRYSLEIK